MVYEEFQISDVFPSDEELARWAMVLSIAWQDLLASNLQLVAEPDAESFINLHNVKRVAAQTFELCKFLRDNEERAHVRRFFESLADEAHQEYDRVFALLDKPAASGVRAFRGNLGRARDYASHYPELDRREVIRAITEVGSSVGVVRHEGTFDSLRLDYADRATEELFFPGASSEEAKGELEQFFEDLRELVLALMRFVQRALDAYLRGRMGVA